MFLNTMTDQVAEVSASNTTDNDDEKIDELTQSLKTLSISVQEYH